VSQYCTTLFLWKRDGCLTVWLVFMQQVEHFVSNSVAGIHAASGTCYNVCNSVTGVLAAIGTCNNV
jgi:hypothetical protein